MSGWTNQKKRFSLPKVYLGAIFCFLSFFILETPSFATQYAIVVHPENTIQLDTNELLQIFKKEYKYWKDGSNVVVYLPSEAKVNDALFSSLGTTHQKLSEHFSRLREQGSRVLPPFYEKTRHIRKVVKRNRAAIGVVEASESQEFRVLFTFNGE